MYNNIVYYLCVYTVYLGMLNFLNLVFFLLLHGNLLQENVFFLHLVYYIISVLKI